MKRKPTVPPMTTNPDAPTVAPEIVESAKAAAATFADKAKRPVTKCVVCSEETSPNSAEGLCWVCRRLKISAWRDSDTQMPAQE